MFNYDKYNIYRAAFILLGVPKKCPTEIHFYPGNLLSQKLYIIYRFFPSMHDYLNPEIIASLPLLGPAGPLMALYLGESYLSTKMKEVSVGYSSGLVAFQ